MRKLKDIHTRLPNIFKSASFYKNSYALRVLLDDTAFSPYCFYQALHKAKEILLSMFLDDSDIYYIKVCRVDDKSSVATFNDEVNESECLEHVVKLYEKFEEDFEEDEYIYAQYSMYKAPKSEKMLIDLLWNPIALLFQQSFSFARDAAYEIYFIDSNQEVSFYPYDNRGMDILCKDLDTYRKTFNKLEPYLFEYDLELMKKRLQN